MTNKEVMVQILNEVTGQSKEDIRLMLAGIEATDSNAKRKFQEELSPTFVIL